MKIKILMALIFSIAASSEVFADKHDHSLVETCSKECPEAKTEKDVHACVAKKAKDPAFKKTGCSIAHAKHEKEEKSHSH